MKASRRGSTRRLLVQVHLWTGVAVGAYLLLMSLTGALLIFRIDLQRAAHPDLLVPKLAGALAPMERVLDELAARWPEHRISGAEAPTDRRPVYLAYVSRGAEFQTVLLDPADGHQLGTLPERSWVRTLQDLHFELLAGRGGRVANGIGAAALLLLAVTGIVIWWPGRRQVRRAVRVDFTREPLRVNWELHRATGFWTLLLLAMWGVSGLYFAFPQAFRGFVGALSPLSAPVRPVRTSAGGPPLPYAQLLDAARAAHPAGHLARVVFPTRPSDALQVQFAQESPTPVAATLETVLLDPVTGAVLTAPERSPSAGDFVMSWLGPLHTGSFAGPVLRLLWCVLGLAPALLFVTGFVSWWNRVVVPARRGSPHRRPFIAGEPRSADPRTGTRPTGAPRDP